ncbi:cytochrome C oxidase subunit II [Silvibacterium sp.]|uniref:cytochrome C oxidase subunit II n=1 Tax=Silvibacterium sp. TaxID=1964179 RepID=UPI0039E64D10
MMPASNALLLTLALWKLYMPPNAVLHGAEFDRLMRWNLIVLLVCFAASHVWLIAAMVRRKRAVQAGAGSPASLLRWILLPLLIALYVAMAVSAQHMWASNRYQGASLEAMQVEVVGEQFQWYFRYPGTDAKFGITRPELVNAAAGNPLGIDPADEAGRDDLVSSVLMVPVGREVDLRIRSLDIIHGFFVPAMRLKQNAVPGMLLHVHFTPTAVGTYPILCSQVCGIGHARMQALLRVVPQADYDRWLAGREQAHARVMNSSSSMSVSTSAQGGVQ